MISAIKDLNQRQRHGRDIGNEQQDTYQNDDKGDIDFGGLPYVGFGNRTGCYQYTGHRRRLLSNRNIELHDQSELNRIDPDLDRNRVGIDERRNDR